MRNRNDLLSAFLAQRPALARFFRRATGSTATAEDLLQEAWLRFATVETAAIDNVPAYLRRISENLVTDLARKQAQRLLSATEIDGILSVADPGPDPEARLIAKDSLTRLRNALAGLPERRRAILLAARLERVPHRDLAQSHGVSTRTIELEIQKAVAHLARALAEP